MRRAICVVGLIVLLVGALGYAESLNLTPRVYSCGARVVYLFDNETGEAHAGLVIVPNGIALTEEDIIVFGGGEVKNLEAWGGGIIVLIRVEIGAGATVQITLSGDNATGGIERAWFLF